MDDFLVLSYDKNRLYQVWSVIEDELRKLKLRINPKSAIYNCNSRGGVTFLGYRYRMEQIKDFSRVTLRVECAPKTVKRVRKRLKNLYNHDLEKYNRSYESYRGYFAGALSKREIEKMVMKLDEK